VEGENVFVILSNLSSRGEQTTTKIDFSFPALKEAAKDP
jgi:hypothetical protein